MSQEEKGSEKFEAVMDDLRSLCKKHGVTINSSMYDAITIRNWTEWDKDDDCINGGNVIDQTDE